jgi:hypothetical protein
MEEFEGTKSLIRTFDLEVTIKGEDQLFPFYIVGIFAR